MAESDYLVETLKTFTNLFTPIWFWKLDTQFHVVHSDCPNESLFQALFLRDGRQKAIEEHMAVSSHPVCITFSSMLGWILAFGTEEDNITSIYVMGPFFVSLNDPETYSDFLAPMKLSREAEQTLQDNLRRLPVLSSSEINRNAVLLHYCVRDERLTVDDVSTFVSIPKHLKQRRKVDINQFEKSSGKWAMEQELLNRIRRGDLTAADTVNGAGQNFEIHAFGNANNMRSAKLNLHQLLTLISRAAVEGGLPQRTAFALCSDYREKLESCSTVAQLQTLSKEAVYDYAARVHNMKRYAQCSPQIRLTCEYIETHPGENLTLDSLAKKAGYSPFHMSRKFHQEMGCSITEYIQRSKLERAKYLLTQTAMSVDDISAELGFNSRSYFTTVFRNMEGITPTEYRRKNKLV